GSSLSPSKLVSTTPPGGTVPVKEMARTSKVAPDTTSSNRGLKASLTNGRHCVSWRPARRGKRLKSGSCLGGQMAAPGRRPTRSFVVTPADGREGDGVRRGARSPARRVAAGPGGRRRKAADPGQWGRAGGRDIGRHPGLPCPAVRTQGASAQGARRARIAYRIG